MQLNKTSHTWFSERSLCDRKWVYTSLARPNHSWEAKGAHTRTSLASESGWARVPMSQTGPCVECHEPDFGRLYVYIYIRAWLPSQAPPGGLASQTRTCMDTLRISQLENKSPRIKKSH
jgi:hypothetical protein